MSTATTRISLAAVAAVATLALSLALAGVVSAAPVGKDGKINACYRVKGKPKGALRVVKSPKARCHRGERKVAWILAGAAGAAGAAGEPGRAGSHGANGDGAVSSSTTLEEKVLALAGRVEELEGILAGVTNKALTDAIAAVPMVETLCGEVTGLIAQTNQLRGSVDSLVSTLSGTLLGAIFGGVGLPPALPETLSCPEA